MLEDEWPESVKEIYREAVAKMDGDEFPLWYGPAHIVWGDGNLESAQWCLDHFKEYDQDLSDHDRQIVWDSLVALAELVDQDLV